ncbi:MAG: globin family protein [Chloroflexota bacterium]
MNPAQVKLVQSTFEIVAPNAETVANLFYQRLFELDPNLRPMFKSDMKAQGAKLMKTLAFVVWGLHETNKLIPVVSQLGERHVGYGVTDEHYDTVGAALLWTLQTGLGEKFTPEVEDAWATAYNLLADVMKHAIAAAEMEPM